MRSHSTAIVWFRRDLRLRDNPALRFALAHAAHIVPIYVFAPEEDGEWAPGAASRWWLHHSLGVLDERLRERDSRLILRRGSTLDALRALAHESRATLLTFNCLYEPHALARDSKVRVALGEQLEIECFNANLWFEPGALRNEAGRPYKVFTPFWRKATERLERVPQPSATPRRIAAPRRWPASLELDELRLLPRIRWDAGIAAAWTPGEAGALAELRRFKKVAMTYATSRNRPDLPGTSRLSPHLHFGEIGPRQVLDVLDLRRARQASLRIFASELGWREFAHHLLYDFPATPTQPLDHRFDHMSWSRRGSLLRAWQRGMTGYPIVDAGMRELWQTGWMHNRVRMIVASFLTKNLQHHWLSGARWFWDTLVDADLANNTLGWQWTAGCGADAAPYYRIFNPVLQAERFDPERRYLRRWVSELAALPDRWIHRPWQAPDAVLAAAGVKLGKTYPRPIVSLSGSRDAALRAYRGVQR